MAEKPTGQLPFTDANNSGDLMRHAALLCLPAILAAAGCSSEPDPAELEAQAEIACEEFVSNQLRAPASAEFVDAYTVNGQADFTEEDVYAGRVDESMYTVRGSVDAQNSFGAMLRSSYVCEVQLDGEDWLLTDLDID